MRIAEVCVLFRVASGVSSMEGTGSIKYKGGMVYNVEAGRRLYVSGDNNVKYEETVTEKNNEDGSKSIVYNSELKSKKGNRTKFIRVTEQEVNANDDPSVRKITRKLVLGNFDPTNPDKNSTRTIQYEYSPEESFLADRGAAATTNNGRSLVVKITDGLSETHSTQSDPGTNQPEDANFNQIPKLEDYNRQRSSSQPIAEASGTYASQYRPGPYQPDAASFNQYPYRPESYGGASRTYPQSRPGTYQPDPANINQHLYKPESYGGVSTTPPQSRTGTYQPDPANINQHLYKPESYGGASRTPPQSRLGSYQPDPANINQIPKPEDYHRERASSQTIGGASGTYPSQYRPGPCQPDPASFNQYSYNSEAYNKPRGY